MRYNKSAEETARVVALRPLPAVDFEFMKSTAGLGDMDASTITLWALKPALIENKTTSIANREQKYGETLKSHAQARHVNVDHVVIDAIGLKLTLLR